LNPLAERTSFSQVVKLLVEISDWMMTTGVGDNVLNDRRYFAVNDSIFINGNMARIAADVKAALTPPCIFH
jgi:hypothetical protein